MSSTTPATPPSSPPRGRPTRPRSRGRPAPTASPSCTPTPPQRQGDGVDVLLVVEHPSRSMSSGISTYSLGLLQGLAELGDTGPGITLHASRAPKTGPDPLAPHRHPVLATPLPGPLMTRAWERGLRPVRTDADVLHSTSLAFPPLAKAPPAAVMVHDTAWRDVPEAYPSRGRRW